MRIGFGRAILAAVAFVCLSQPAVAHHGWQCATYAASHSDVALRGNAHSWWDHAEGVYQRAHRPEVGSVMVMKATRAMPMGHVAIVSRVLGDREVLLTHANWRGDGRVETDVRAIDVSPDGDWSQVRVWYAPSHAMGLRNCPIFGFILPHRATDLAMAGSDGAAPAGQAPSAAAD
ncbi:MAG: CHAP domain-containing protein [Sphingomonadales bacterium]|nr:CHAP domain-containing protein [Sphingomonadales bacterium]